jgi:hypothetical protein
LSGSSASVAHRAERPPRKRKATGSRPVRGSALSQHATLAQQAERPTCHGQVTRSTRVGGSQGSGADPASNGGVKDNAGRSPSRPPMALRAGAHVSSVGTGRPVRHRGRAPGGCSSVRESAASPSPRSPVRTRSSTPDRPSPIGKRRHAQTVDDQGSSPWGGTQDGWNAPRRRGNEF